jgi:hypothetical protein
MTHVWERSRHAGSDLLMLLAIADFSDDEGNAYPSVATLATKCRMKARNAQYVLRTLMDSGELEIRVNEGPRGTNLYRIVFTNLGVQAGAGVQTFAGVQRSAQRGATQCATPPQRSAPEPSLNRQEPSSKTVSANTPGRLACPHEQIKALYSELCPELPAIKVWDTGRQTSLRARWNAMAKAKGWKSEAEGLAWFRKFFETVAASDFLMGRIAPRPGYENKQFNIDFLTSTRGFTGVIEGKYANRGAA